METLDECSVLIPSATLEDFGNCKSDTEARSLLAAWTCLWHPALLAQTEQTPTWYRADAPPTPDGHRVIAVPDPSLEQLPSDFRRKCDANPDCLWVVGGDRSEMLAVIGLAAEDPAYTPLREGQREIGVEDFYAAGYLSLQVQVMTRKLRYTSNLDELYLQSRIVAAAKAFLERDAAGSRDALHDVFDCLAEERDHYFSSDPHLIDLTLLTPGTLEDAAKSGWLDRLPAHASMDHEADNVLGIARNLLLDGSVARAVVDDPQSAAAVALRDALREDAIGWVGGSAEANSACLDSQTLLNAENAFAEGTRLAEAAFGSQPAVYAALSGTTPADLISLLSGLGYHGVIPIDFAAGTGFGDESKVLVGSGDSEMEALTAKPIDAASDRSFLAIGATLGESIDSGEVATALLVHWPERVCDSFLDLCRAASWCVALGRFWTLPRYFTEGERPYHTGTLKALARESADSLASRINDTSVDLTLASFAEDFRSTVQHECSTLIQGIAGCANPSLVDDDQRDKDASASDWLVSAFQLSQTSEDAGTLFCVNPHGIAMRQQGQLRGGGPPSNPFVYASTGAGENRADVTFDCPAMGFTRLSASEPIPRGSLLKRLTRGKKGIADGLVLRNEFFAASISDESGSIAGVYSGSRGNRLSMRLIGVQAGAESSQMVCRSVRTITSTPAEGEIETAGEVQNQSGEAIADFRIVYRAERGSRKLDITGSIKPRFTSADSKLWDNHIAVRTAVAEESASCRPLVRDRVHRSGVRKIVAPLGVLIDEAEKQTLVASFGLPLHRRVGDRFLDTLVHDCGSAEEADFRLAYVFDGGNAVATARACISPPELLALSSESKSTEQAWLVHCSSRDTLVVSMTTARRADGKLASRLRLVQTRSKSGKITLQFCNFAMAAFLAGGEGIDRSLEELPEDVTVEDGNVSLTLAGHQSADLVVVFDV